MGRLGWRSRHVIVNCAWAGLALAGFAVLAPARAEAPMTRFTVFMHAGPGRQYAVTDEIEKWTRLDVVGCRDGWCQIRSAGVLGWVQQSLLTDTPPIATPAPGQKPVQCVDFARTGWPDGGNLNRACIYPAQ